MTALLGEYKISIFLIKGCAFNNNLYKLNRPRGVSDIDILVKPEDKESFRKILQCLGFKKNIAKDKKPFEELYEESWSNIITKTTIDLHFNIANPYLFPIKEESLFTESYEHPFYNSKYVRVLSAELNIIVSALHMFKDNYVYHYASIDTALIIKHNMIDNKRLNRIAKENNFQNILRLHINIVDEIFSKKPIDSNKIAIWPLLKDYKKNSLIFRLQQLYSIIFYTDSKVKAINFLFNYCRAYLCIQVREGKLRK